MVEIERLFLFPLPDVQLFPHALVPLHVFEPRYRAMARDCLSSSRRMALGTLEPGFEADYEGRPPVKPVCGMGEIVAHHRHPDGRHEILLRGVSRVRLVGELPPDEPYRLARAEVLDDVLRVGADFELARRSLLVLCDRLASALPTGGETLRSLARKEDDPAATVDLLAAALVTDPDERQALLERLDVMARFDRVAEVIAGVLQRLDEARGTSTRN